MGQTKVIKTNISPTWDEPIEITLSLETRLADCSLLVEVYDHDDAGAHDLLGSATVAGQALVALLCPDKAQDIETQSTVLPLEMEQKVKGKSKTVVGGEIILRGGGSLVPELLSHKGEQNHSSSDLEKLEQQGTEAEDQQQLAGTHAGALGVERTAAQRMVEDAYEVLHSSIPEEYLLSVNSARGLINTDSLKNRFV